MVHVLLFVFSGSTFIPHAQFSVRPSAQMVEVSVDEIKDSVPVSHLIIPVKAGVSDDRILISPIKILGKGASLKKVARSQSGVRTKANPDYFQNPPPEYPELARQMRQEGLVILVVDVDRQGELITVGIKQSSRFRLLDQAALKAVRHWKFQPGSIGGIPIESKVTVPIRFRLEQ